MLKIIIHSGNSNLSCELALHILQCIILIYKEEDRKHIEEYDEKLNLHLLFLGILLNSLVTLANNLPTPQNSNMEFFVWYIVRRKLKHKYMKYIHIVHSIYHLLAVLILGKIACNPSSHWLINEWIKKTLYFHTVILSWRRIWFWCAL